MKSTLEDLRKFISRQVKLDRLGANSAQSYLTSIDRVFEYASEQERADVQAVDLEQLFSRFRKRSSLQENTQVSYEGRVKAALNNFSKKLAQGDADEPATTAGKLSIPLRNGVVLVDGLPNDLSEAEARKIGAVILAMASQ